MSRHLSKPQTLVAGLLLSFAALAQQPVQEAIDQVVYEVVDAVEQRAAAVVSRHRSVDAWRHGFADDDVTPPRVRVPIEMRRALDKLRYEFNRSLERLESKLRHELARLESTFRRDTGRDAEVALVLARRAELEAAVDEAWKAFRRDVATEIARASERRERIIAPLLLED